MQCEKNIYNYDDAFLLINKTANSFILGRIFLRFCYLLADKMIKVTIRL